MITILRSLTPRDSRYASNLFVTFDASPLIERDVNELISTYGKHTRLLAYAGDIENMYNRLPLAESPGCPRRKCVRNSDVTTLNTSGRVLENLTRKVISPTLTSSAKKKI
jgi:hypothetical protein